MARSKKKKNQNKTVLGAILIAVCVVLLGVAGVAAFVLRGNEPSIDKATNCPTDHLDYAVAVLIDLTDPISKSQEAALKNALGELRDTTPKYGRFDLYTISGATGASRDPIFSACSPGSGAQVESELTGNKLLEDRIWKKQFGDKLTATLDEASQQTTSQNSPIFEAIQFVGARTFGTPIVREAKTKKLVIVSDLIHHTNEFSQYKTISAHAELRKLPYYARIKPQLHGAVVDFYVLFRDTSRNVQKQPWQAFWYEHIREGGGQGDRWVPLQ